jgi:protein-tyrosine phosphatase
MNILFICTGNINRSAAAEIILKQLTDRCDVQSAAVTTTNNGRKTTKRMMQALEHYGFKSEPVKSNQITKEQFDWADIIFYMQPSHLKSLSSLFPLKDLSKAKPLVQYSTDKLKKIEDPHFTGKHELVVNQIHQCLYNFLYLMGWK